MFVQQALYNAQEVTQVNVPAISGDLGILSAHVPTVEQIRPGVLEVIESSGTSKKFFGTFAHIAHQWHVLNRTRSLN